MYSIKQLTGNLVIVSPIPNAEAKTASGLILPNTKGKETICEVIKVGNEVTNENIKEDQFVTVESVVLQQSTELDKIYDFQKDKRKYYLVQQFGITSIVEPIKNESEV